MADDGPLTKKVLQYSETIREIASSARRPEDWAPVAALVAVDDFERVGNFLEVQDWRQCTEMLTKWASGIDRFETTVHRISELPGLVYYEIEERHYVGDAVTVLNSLTVFEFDDEEKIRHLDVFVQMPR
jgi:limonene-1,2-epoxide hydrolase